jgi:hypothetical protein
MSVEATIEKNIQNQTVRVTLVISERDIMEHMSYIEEGMAVVLGSGPQEFVMLGPRETLSNFFGRLAVFCAAKEAEARRDHP